jgi:hypothetical protein
LLHGFAKEWGRRFGVRIGRLAAAGIFLSFAAALLAIGDEGDTDQRGAVSRAMWLLSLFALCPIAVSLARRERPDFGTAELAHLRAVSPSSSRLAELLATYRILLPAALLPALGLSLLAVLVSENRPDLVGGVSTLVGACFYAAALTALLGFLSHTAARLWPAHGRAALLSLLLVPYAASAVFPNTPNVPATFEWLLDLTVVRSGR